MPGGVDTHCHIEQLRPTGGVDEESFVTGSTACLAGGTTSVVTFRRAVQRSWHSRDIGRIPSAGDNRRWWIIASIRSSPIPRTSVVRDEIPEVVASGVRSLKVFLTYEPSHLDDREYIRVLAAARRNGALVTVHCENYEAIRWRTAALMADGRSAPKYHAWSRPKVVEREATYRAIALAEIGGPADPGVPRVLPGGGGGDRTGAGARPEGVGGDLSAIFRAGRGRHGSAGLRGCQVHLQSEPAHEAKTSEALWE